MITQWLVNGLIQAGLLVVVAWALSRWIREVVGRALLAFVLWGAALMYVYFAAKAGQGAGWLTAELLGVAVFGGLGLLGLLRSPMWLAVGWGLHPAWDLALHYFGPGHAFAPEPIAVACLSFDLVVAAYIVVDYHFGLGGRRSSGRRSAVAGISRSLVS
jgi:hypothetical protein